MFTLTPEQMAGLSPEQQIALARFQLAFGTYPAAVTAAQIDPSLLALATAESTVASDPVGKPAPTSMSDAQSAKPVTTRLRNFDSGSTGHGSTGGGDASEEVEDDDSSTDEDSDDDDKNHSKLPLSTSSDRTSTYKRLGYLTWTDPNYITLRRKCTKALKKEPVPFKINSGWSSLATLAARQAQVNKVMKVASKMATPVAMTNDCALAMLLSLCKNKRRNFNRANKANGLPSRIGRPETSGNWVGQKKTPKPKKATKVNEMESSAVNKVSLVSSSMAAAELPNPSGFDPPNPPDVIPPEVTTAAPTVVLAAVPDVVPAMPAIPAPSVASGAQLPELIDFRGTGTATHDSELDQPTQSQFTQEISAKHAEHPEQVNVIPLAPTVECTAGILDQANSDAIPTTAEPMTAESPAIPAAADVAKQANRKRKHGHPRKNTEANQDTSNNTTGKTKIDVNGIDNKDGGIEATQASQWLKPTFWKKKGQSVATDEPVVPRRSSRVHLKKESQSQALFTGTPVTPTAMKKFKQEQSQAKKARRRAAEAPDSDSDRLGYIVFSDMDDGSDDEL